MRTEPMKLKTETTRREFAQISTGALLGTLLTDKGFAENPMNPDICIYGANASGIMAAVAASKSGVIPSVVLETHSTSQKFESDRNLCL